jgi:NAD(P)-dependent dehydrogenase (short-subunit alcohol dehydrogenase family)
MPEQPTRSVFITGAAAGIGAATARLLADRGYLVFAGIHEDPGSLAGIPRIRSVAIDVTDPAGITAAAEQVGREIAGTGLHAVINNAGIIVQGPLELVPARELRRQFEVNTLGPVYVTQAFLPLLRGGGGRVVNISAPTAHVPVPFMAPISASKAALVSLSDALRVELSAWKIPVVVVEPGGTATDIFAKADAAAQAALASADRGQVALYRTHLEAVAAAAAKQKLGPIDAVADAIVRAVEARRPKRRYTAGSGTRLFGVLSHLPVGMRDRLVSGAFGVGNIEPGT